MRGLAAASLVYRCNLPCLCRLLLKTHHILQKVSLKQTKKGHSSHFNKNIKRRFRILYDFYKKNIKTQATTIKTIF